VILAPVPATFVVAGVLHANQGALVLLCALAAFGGVLVLPHALFGRVVIIGETLTATRPFLASESPRGGVNVRTLLRISSVGRKYGSFTSRGLAMWRPMLRLQDRQGGEAWMEAWGWSDKQALFSELREAALAANASVDGLTFRRLGFVPTQRG
jgi:hypothetical protein